MGQHIVITVLIIVVFLFLQDITLRISKAIVAWLDAKNIVEMMENKYKLDAIIWKKIMKDIEIVKRTKIYNLIKTIPIVNIFYSFYYYKIIIKKIKSHYFYTRMFIKMTKEEKQEFDKKQDIFKKRNYIFEISKLR